MSLGPGQVLPELDHPPPGPAPFPQRGGPLICLTSHMSFLSPTLGNKGAKVTLP